MNEEFLNILATEAILEASNPKRVKGELEMFVYHNWELLIVPITILLYVLG